MTQEKTVYNIIALNGKSSDESDVYCLRQNGKDVIIAPCMIFYKLCYELPISAEIRRGDLLISSHNCILVHLDIGFAGIYARRILTLQKEKETMFGEGEGKYVKLSKPGGKNKP